MTLITASDLAWRPPGEARLVLDRVDLHLDSGESLVLQGPSGCGKSTLLRCLVALEPLDRGTVRFRGQLLGPDSVLGLRRRVLYLAQQPAAVGVRVADELAFARDIAGATAADQAPLLQRLGLADLPDDRPFDRLSQGERQRVCFVRALTLQPTVLLLDEPTAALDPDAALALEALVAEWLAADTHRAAIWVTHDPVQAARVGTRTLFLGAHP